MRWGFRDIVDEIQNQFGVQLQIPFCRQSNNKEDDETDDEDEEKPKPKKGVKKSTAINFQTKQRSSMYNKSKICCRKSIWSFKKNKAIDIMRNTVLGHNAIDLRIAAAFYNMSFN